MLALPCRWASSAKILSSMAASVGRSASVSGMVAAVVPVLACRVQAGVRGCGSAGRRGKRRVNTVPASRVDLERARRALSQVGLLDRAGGWPAVACRAGTRTGAHAALVAARRTGGHARRAHAHRDSRVDRTAVATPWLHGPAGHARCDGGGGAGRSRGAGRSGPMRALRISTGDLIRSLMTAASLASSTTVARPLD